MGTCCRRGDSRGFNKKPVRLVLLSTSTSATIKGGKALVRTNKSRTSKEDWHALVPYALDGSSPSTSRRCPVRPP
jgi:hypothetical protein